MDGPNKDDIPMLSDTYFHPSDDPRDVELPRYGGWNTARGATTRSTSMSLPGNSGSYGCGESNLISQTGPLGKLRTTAFISMSAPIGVKNRSQDQLHQKRHFFGVKSAAVMAEEFSCDNEVGNEMLEDAYAAKNDHLLRSGPLGRCNDPYCTTCPSYYSQPIDHKISKASTSLEAKFYNALHGDTKGLIRRLLSHLYVPIMNPHAKIVQQWNKFFVISCLVAIFVDPLFFFPLSVQKDSKCLVLDWSLARALALVRSITDIIYLLHMGLQFRLAYVAPESRVVGTGDLVDDPKKVAVHYLRGYFFLDLFIVLPLPQIMILSVLPKYVGSSAANYAKNLLRASVLLQYLPRISRFLPLLSGQSATGFIFETAWANFVINLLIFVLAGHVVGSCWYLFGLQRINQCLRDACLDTEGDDCKRFIDCGRGNSIKKFNTTPGWIEWRDNADAVACFNTDNGTLDYGIYQQVTKISTKGSLITRYVYSLFWGFQQISTLAGNLVPSEFTLEVLFTMGIIGLGLLLFALLIGNMQNFLQALGRRRLEMQLRRRDVEQWMSHRRLPEELRRQVRQSERFTWAATRGVNEELLLENFPEDLQRDIRRHLFKFVKRVRIFTLMNEPMLDAIRERLRQKLFIKGSRVLYKGGTIDKMVFIVRGKMESIGSDGNIAPLSEGDICGEELLTWCLENSPVNTDGKKVRSLGQRLLSGRDVHCVTNVEAFVLRAIDLEEVTSLFARFLRSPLFQSAIRYESPYWRALAATCIQVSWRYRRKRLNRIPKLSAKAAE